MQSQLLKDLKAGQVILSFNGNTLTADNYLLVDGEKKHGVSELQLYYITWALHSRGRRLLVAAPFISALPTDQLCKVDSIGKKHLIGFVQSKYSKSILILKYFRRAIIKKC